MSWRLRFLVLSVLTALFGASNGACAEEKRLTAAYDIFTGGLRAVEMDIDLGIDGDGYAIEARLRTRGIFGTLFPWEQVNRVAGTISRSVALPTRFEQRGKFRRQERSVEIAYEAGKVLRFRTLPTGEEDADREPLALAEVDSALDPLTGIVLLLLRIGSGGDCAGGYDGFDGRRLFRIEVSDAGTETVLASLPGGGSADRPARICDFVYRQTGGFARRVTWGPDRQREPRPGRFWLVQVEPGGAAVPVHMELENSWGRMIAQLRDIGPGR